MSGTGGTWLGGASARVAAWLLRGGGGELRATVFILSLKGFGGGLAQRGGRLEVPLARSVQGCVCGSQSAAVVMVCLKAFVGCLAQGEGLGGASG